MIEEHPHKIKLLMQLHYSRLSEKDRRQYAALESLKIGRGGTTYISKLLGVDRSTVIRGKKELTSASGVSLLPEGRQRKAGGGRKKNDRTS